MTLIPITTYSKPSESKWYPNSIPVTIQVYYVMGKQVLAKHSLCLDKMD